jgi:hypothetical protein
LSFVRCVTPGVLRIRAGLARDHSGAWIPSDDFAIHDFAITSGWLIIVLLG